MFTLNEIVDLLNSKRLCVTCKTVSELVGQPFGCIKKALPTQEYRANFLWPHDKGSIEEAGYEFVNAKTEAYREQWWDILKERIGEEHR